MAEHEQLGRDVVEAMRELAPRKSLAVVNAFYAALYELSRRTGQTPRTVLEVVFSEAPSDEEWRERFVPLWREFLDESDAAA